MKRIGFLIVVTFCFLSTQCDEDEIGVGFDNACDDVVIVDDIAYGNVESDAFMFGDVQISGDCLSISIGASGCDGDTWGYALIDSGAVAESLPEQRFLKFEFKNNEDCTAAIGRTVSFSLEPLQINGSDTVILNLDNWQTPITYSY